MTQQLVGSKYDAFHAMRCRTSNNGISVMPVAGPSPQPAAVVALNGGLEFDTIAFYAMKRGEPPTVPPPASLNPNRIFLEGWQSAPFPVPDQGTIMCYAIAGFYKWAILTPEGLESDFMLGQLPFPGLDPDERFPSSYFNYQLINQNIARIIPGGPPPEYDYSLPTNLRVIIDRSDNGNG